LHLLRSVTYCSPKPQNPTKLIMDYPAYEQFLPTIEKVTVTQSTEMERPQTSAAEISLTRRLTYRKSKAVSLLTEEEKDE